MNKFIIFTLCIAILLVGCVQPVEPLVEEEEKESAFKEVTVEEELVKGLEDEDVTVKETTPKEEEVVSEPEALLATESEFVSNIVCDEEKGKLSFTLTNPIKKTLSLTQLSVMDTSSKEAFKLTINGRSIRDLPDWCEDTEALAPGESVACFTDFTPNELGDILVRTGKDNFMNPLGNYIRAKTTALKAEATFTCS